MIKRHIRYSAVQFAVQNGDYQADAADVHFNLTFSEDTDKPTLTIQIQETGEVFVLRKNP